MISYLYEVTQTNINTNYYLRHEDSRIFDILHISQDFFRVSAIFGLQSKHKIRQ